MVVSPQYDPWGMTNNLTAFDYAKPNMIPLIDPYWKQFPAMNPLWHSILAFVTFVIGIISMAGNLMVVNIFTRTPGLRTPSNLLIVNLALSDFLMMFLNGPIMTFNCIKKTWWLGPLSCELYGFAGSLLGCVSIWTMTMIALDRYNVIVKGLSAKPLTMTSVMVRILIIWLICTAWALPPFFGWNRYVPEGNMTGCTVDYINKAWLSRSYIYVYAIFCYWIPLFTIIFSYTFILKVSDILPLWHMGSTDISLF